MKFAFTVAAVAAAFFASVSAHAHELSERGHGPARMDTRAASLPKVITRCTKDKTVALTFDDGPVFYNGKKILALLKKYKAKGTFFWNGDNNSCIYDRAEREYMQQVYAAGHQVGSHTWRHAHLPKLTYDQVHDEFWRVEQALQRILGVTPAFMRPPYGEYNDIVRRVAKERKQHVTNWDFDSEDSIGATVKESEKFYKNKLNAHPSSILTLNHENHNTTADHVLPYVLDLLSHTGYKLVTVAECLELEPYQKIAQPSQYNSSTWKC